MNPWETLIASTDRFYPFILFLRRTISKKVHFFFGLSVFQRSEGMIHFRFVLLTEVGLFYTKSLILSIEKNLRNFS